MLSRRVPPPKRILSRARRTARRLRVGGHQMGKSSRPLGVLMGAVMRVTIALTGRRSTAGPYWRALLSVLLRNPRGLEAFVNLAAMYLHFSKQADFAVNAVQREIAYLKEIGEAAFNERVLARMADEVT